ncbi:MAG: sulfotransferase [Acidimicrobiales bacterium]
MGWDVGPPDFVGVGAQRSGTSWWFTLISGHPGVSRAPGSHKEVHFLDQFSAVGPPDDAARAYHDHFPRQPDRIAGEWTPRYMHDFWAPRLLESLAPRARVLVMLRDPIERYRSGLAHEAAKPDAPGAVFLAGDAFARGLYYRQLERILLHFDRSRLLVLQFEACLARPAAELARTYAFLGLEAPHRPPDNLTERVTLSPGTKMELGDSQRRGLVEAYREETSLLLDAYPEIDGELWRSMKEDARWG